MRSLLLILPFLLFLSGPQKTTRLTGVVFEQGTTRPVPEATVETVTLEKPYRSTTDAQGRFLLTIPADVTLVRIRVTKDGYVPREDWVDVSSAIARAPIELERINKPKAGSPRPPSLRSPISQLQTLALVNCQPIGTQDSVSVHSTFQNGPTLTSFYTEGKEQTIPFQRRPERLYVEPPGTKVAASDLPMQMTLGKCGDKDCKITIKAFTDSGVVVDTGAAIVLTDKRETCGVQVTMTMLDAAVSQPSERPSSPTVVQAPYGNLAKRSRDLGTALLHFAEERQQIQPDAKSHLQDYLDWFTRNDGGFRAFYFDNVKTLQKDLAAANVKDIRLDELIAKHEQFYNERNRLPPATVFSNAPMYHLSIEDIEEIGQRFTFLVSQIPGAVDDEVFLVTVEWAKFSIGGKGFGTNFWIEYPSPDSCGLSPIQAIYFIRIKNLRSTPITVIGYSIDVAGVPLVRVQTGMGNIVGIPVNETIFGAPIMGRIKPGDPIRFGQGPGFSMTQIPLNESDFAHGLVLQMDLIDNLLKAPLQPNIPVRGWAFFQLPNENSFSAAGAGHLTLETDDSRTFSYEFNLRNPHPDMDILDRAITVKSFADLSHCKRP
jgi:hypothetical protein